MKLYGWNGDIIAVTTEAEVLFLSLVFFNIYLIFLHEISFRYVIEA